MQAGRRRFVQGTLVAACAVAGCAPEALDTAHIDGGFVGANHALGHRLRQGAPLAPPDKTLRSGVLVLGAGVAGLAAARALRLRGVDDFALLDLEDQPGGNSRAGLLGGMACPLGAHYLPLPGDDAPDLQDLLEEFGLRQRIAGRWSYDERHLCHSPQERLFIHGQWQEGLLPYAESGSATLAQYQKFSALVEQARTQARWSIPAQRGAATLLQRTLARIPFASYLDQQQLADPALRWYLDYCCRDDYGAGLDSVSAWAGIHYFASRHGFHVPGAESGERDAVLTWPEGNAWLTRRLAAPLQQRWQPGRLVLRLAQSRSGVEADVWHAASQTLERWQARRAVVALPVHVAARVLQNPPDALRQGAARLASAAWLVANLHIDAPLRDRPGAAPSWDNVLYGDRHSAPGLGYVDAMHQSLRRVPAASVLTYYRALGHSAAARQGLLDQPWSAWRDAIVAELARAHPDLAARTQRLEISRYGHAMAVPLPQPDGHLGLGPPPEPGAAQRARCSSSAWFFERLGFAHSDWAGYSVFEEAFAAGHAAGLWAASV